MNRDVVSELKAEMEMLQTRRQADQVRIEQLTRAIAALEGRTPVATTGRTDGPSVTDMVLGVAREQWPNAQVFDQATLVAATAKRFPDQTAKIKRGIYGVVRKLVNDKKFHRCAGGFQVLP